MHTIKDGFINKVTQAATNAVGASVVLQLGISNHQQYSTQYPNATVHMGAGPPGTPGVRAIKFSPTHQQVQNTLQNNRDILFELFLTEIIQYWFDFLLDIYQEALNQNASGAANYPVPSAKTKIDLSLTGASLIQNIEESACKDFDFLAAPEKIRIIKTLLGVNLSSVTNDVEILKVNVQVRNILQHRNGIVNTKDLSDLGVASINEDHGNSVNSVSAGQRITRTGFDIENLVDSLIKIANTLIP